MSTKGKPPRLITVTPKMAQRWLERMAPNRNLNKRRVQQYAADMKAGRWKVNGETIKISRLEEISDGQHRLQASIEADTAFRTWVVFDVDPDAMDTIDTGKARSLADVLQIGGEKHTRTLAAAVRLLHHYHAGDLRATGGAAASISHPQLEETLERHPFLREAVETVRKSPKIQPAAAIAAAYCLAHERDKTRAAEWIEAVLWGENLTRTSPVYLLRERLLAPRSATTEQLRAAVVMALAIKSFNAFRAGKTLNQLAWRTEGKHAEDFPTVD